MYKKFSLAVLILLVLSMSLACSTPAQNEAAPATQSEPVAEATSEPASEAPVVSELKNLSIGGAGTSGTFYIMAAAYADLITKNLGINAVAEVTAGSVENATLLADEKIELGVLQLDVAMDAVNGAGKFTEKVPLKVIAPMYPNVVQIVTLKDSEINTFADLKGKRVSVGSPGSGILATNEVILKTLGMSLDDIKPQYLSFAETTDAFRNNAVDAVIVNTAAPAPFLTDLETTHEIKFVPLTDEEIAKFTGAFDYYVEATIPGGTFKTVPEDVKTFAVWIALVSRDDFPESDAYNITKVLMESQDMLKDVHVVSKYMTLDNVKFIQGLEYHPGSLKYLNENNATLK